MIYGTPVYSILGFKLGIVQLEMFNIVLALRCWAKVWAHRAILNMALVQVVQSGKSRDDFLPACLMYIWLLVAAFDNDLQITHIQGSSTLIADTLFRLHSGAPASPSILQATKDKCVWDLILLLFFKFKPICMILGA